MRGYAVAAAALLLSGRAAACPIAIGLKLASDAGDPAAARQAIAAAYRQFLAAGGAGSRLVGAQIMPDAAGRNETAVFISVMAPDEAASSRVIAAAKSAGLAPTEPPPHPACAAPGPLPAPAAPATISVVGTCRAAAPADQVEYDAIFPGAPDTAGLTQPALGFVAGVRALNIGAEISDADTMAPTARAFLVHTRHQAPPPPTVRVVTHTLDALPALVKLAHSEGATESVFEPGIAAPATVARLVGRCVSGAAASARQEADALAEGAGTRVAAALPPGEAYPLGPVTAASGAPARTAALRAGSDAESRAATAPVGAVTFGVALPASFTLDGAPAAAAPVRVQASCTADLTPDRKRFVFTGSAAVLREVVAQVDGLGRAPRALPGAPPALEAELSRPPYYPGPWKLARETGAQLAEQGLLAPATLARRRLVCLRQAAAAALAEGRALLAAVGAESGAVRSILGPRPAPGLEGAADITVVLTLGIAAP